MKKKFFLYLSIWRTTQTWVCWFWKHFKVFEFQIWYGTIYATLLNMDILKKHTRTLLHNYTKVNIWDSAIYSKPSYVPTPVSYRLLWQKGCGYHEIFQTSLSRYKGLSLKKKKKKKDIKRFSTIYLTTYF